MTGGELKKYAYTVGPIRLGNAVEVAVMVGVGGIGVSVGASVTGISVEVGIRVGDAGGSVASAVGANNAVRVRSGVGMLCVPPPSEGMLHAARIIPRLINIKGNLFIPASISSIVYQESRCMFQAR